MPERFAARLPDHPFLQSAALHAAAGDGRRPGDAARGRRSALSAFADLRLGKGVVAGKDTPGFIANRIGTYWMQAAIDEAIELGLTVEEADAVDGPAAWASPRPACSGCSIWSAST